MRFTRMWYIPRGHFILAWGLWNLFFVPTLLSNRTYPTPGCQLPGHCVWSHSSLSAYRLILCKLTALQGQSLVSSRAGSIQSIQRYFDLKVTAPPHKIIFFWIPLLRGSLLSILHYPYVGMASAPWRNELLDHKDPMLFIAHPACLARRVFCHW